MELLDALREALYLRRSEEPRSAFGVGDLVACNLLLSQFKAADIEKTLHSNMAFLQIVLARRATDLRQFSGQSNGFTQRVRSQFTGHSRW